MTTLHLLGFPHVQTIKEGTSTCAYTSKLIRFCEMMQPHGWRIILYGGERNDAPCAEHVSLYSEEEQHAWYGKPDAATLPNIARFDATAEPWRVMNARAITAIRERAEPHDFLLPLGGLAQRPIADALPQLLCAEWAVGYEGWFANFCCFESYAWRHYCYGRAGIEDGRWFHAVIPNFFDPADFEIDSKDDYLLFLGRVTPRKGPLVAAEIARELGLPLCVAGPGSDPALLTQLRGMGANYVGAVGPLERKRLLSRARALLAPTTYIEPFGGVAVEAQLSGTPAITTDWGAFTETVEPEWRFRTLREGCEAVERTANADGLALRKLALERFSLDAVAPLFARWFGELASLWGEGWYERAAA